LALLLDREPGSAGLFFCNHSMAAVNAADGLGGLWRLISGSIKLFVIPGCARFGAGPESIAL
jgi:hypothetical protein